MPILVAVCGGECYVVSHIKQRRQVFKKALEQGFTP